MFEKPTLIDRELEALKIHQRAYQQSLGILETLPKSPERQRTIDLEKGALSQVEGRISELDLLATPNA